MDPKFPADMPIASIQRVIAIIRAKSVVVDRAEFALHGWWTVGWLLPKALGDPVRPIGSMTAATDEDCCQTLEDMCGDLTATQGIGPLAAKMLLAWLLRWLTA